MLPEAEAYDIASNMNVSRETFQKLRSFEAELCRWQRQINLVGRRSDEAFWTHDVADAAFLARLRPNEVVLDWGSGAGLPGLLWALISQSGRLVSVEANGKKAAFQRHVSRLVDIVDRVDVRTDRIGNVTGTEHVRTVTARALADLSTLFTLWADHEPGVSNALFFKGERFEQELHAATQAFEFDCVVHSHPFNSGSVLLEISDLHRR